MASWSEFALTKLLSAIDGALEEQHVQRAKTDTVAAGKMLKLYIERCGSKTG